MRLLTLPAVVLLTRPTLAQQTSPDNDGLRPGETRAPKKLWKYYEREERLQEQQEAEARLRANAELKKSANAVSTQASLLIPTTALEGAITDDLRGADNGKAAARFIDGHTLLTADQIRDTVRHLRFQPFHLATPAPEETVHLASLKADDAPDSVDAPRLAFVSGNTRLGDPVLYATMVLSTPANADGKQILDEHQLALQARLDQPVPDYASMPEPPLKLALQHLQRPSDLVAFNLLRVNLRIARLAGATFYADKLEPQFPRKLRLWEPAYFQFYDPNYIPGYFGHDASSREMDASVTQVVRVTMIGPGKFRLEEWNSYQLAHSRDFSLGPQLDATRQTSMIRAISVIEFTAGGKLRRYFYPQLIGRGTRSLAQTDSIPSLRESASVLDPCCTK